MQVGGDGSQAFLKLENFWYHITYLEVLHRLLIFPNSFPFAYW